MTRRPLYYRNSQWPALLLSLATTASCGAGAEPSTSSPDLSSVPVSVVDATMDSAPSDAIEKGGDGPAGCEGALQPLSTAIFGTSVHEPTRYLVLTDAHSLACNELGSTPSCGCAAPCECYLLQVQMPQSPAMGDHKLTDLFAQYTIEMIMPGGFTSSETHQVTAGTLHVSRLDGSTLEARLCDVQVNGIGAAPIHGSFTATACF